MSQNNNTATNQLAIKKCKDLILNRFRKIDLYKCLRRINHTASGSRSKLQMLLYIILNLHTDDEELVKIILDRGEVMDYCLKTGLEIDDIRMIPALGFKFSSDYVEHKDVMNMRRLYFYDDVKRIGGWNYVTVRSIDHNVSLSFKLPSNLCRKIFFEDGSEMSPQTAFLLRCVRINDGNKTIDVPKDDYPVGMKLFINNVDVTTLLPREIAYTTSDRRERLSYPTILNKGIEECKEDCQHSKYLNIRVEFKRDDNKNNTYAFGIFSSTQKSVKDLCNMILSREKISIDEFKEDLHEFMPKSGDIELDCTKISLLSSITFRRIRIPFRGMNCNHIIPDDLEEYLEFNKDTEKWLCNICKNPCTPNDIMVDEFFEKILHKYPKDDEIFLYNEQRLKYKLSKGKEMYIEDLLKEENEIEMDDVDVIVIDSDDEVSIMTRRSTNLRTSTFMKSLESQKRRSKSVRRSSRFINKTVNLSYKKFLPC
uniref:SP-RING-type domain-containing protein n=1 Tax=Strongyloides venezuelensis TaxID=75913 RepID=A0A0K0FM42_STRVS